MAEWIGFERRARRCYGFDEVALVPGSLTINPNEVDTSWAIGDMKFSVPILAASMDGVVDVKFASKPVMIIPTKSLNKSPAPLPKNPPSLFRVFI